MRLISRSVLREIWPPFLLGFVAYTFILLVRTIYTLADFFVRRSASLLDVGRLVLLSLPWIVVLTLPMALLVGVLVGLGRLSGDSETVALRACGVGPAALYRPTLTAAALLAGGVFLLYNVVLPASNEAFSRSMVHVAATSIVNLAQPRTFREARPGVTLFFDRTGADGRSLEGVFVKLGEEWEPDNRVILARRGVLTLEGERLWLDLFSSTLHDYDTADASRYRINRNESQRILLAGDIWNSPGARVSYEKSLRAQSLRELFATARRSRSLSPEEHRMAWVEIHKKLSIPFACFAFAVIGIPLAEASRRGGRSSGFAISLAILVLYYVLLSGGEIWAQKGELPPGIAIWLPNALILALGLVAKARAGTEGRLWGLRRPAVPSASVVTPRGAGRPRFGSWLRFPEILDRYVLMRFLAILGLVSLSVFLLAVVVDYADHLDEIARHRPPWTVIAGYYRYFLLSIGLQIAPFVTLLATMIALGIFSKNNEDTAFKASGVSLHRLAVPILAAAVILSGLAFSAGEYVLPMAKRRELELKNVIYGRPVDWVKAPVAGDWHSAGDGRIWHRAEMDTEKGLLLSPAVFEFDSNLQLVRRDGAKEAHWNGEVWVFRQGWTRTFGGPEETSFETYLERRVRGDPPRAFAREKRTPAQMRFRELERYVRRLKASGYPTAALETGLHAKLSSPLMIVLMSLMAVPFAFRVGRRGAMAGIGTGLALGIAFLMSTAFFTKLGEAAALPPLLAAWSPDVLAGTIATYLLLRLRT